jgi:Flp pilus assembly protein TadD
LSLGWAAGPDVAQARKLYGLTEYQRSLAILLGIPAKDAEVWSLIGLNHYGQGDYKKAAEALEKAFAAEPANSGYALWLGRALGRRAETSSPFTAPGLATKARQHFEKAVALDARNIEAHNDLFEYYLEAPGFLGGGLDKAAAMAARIAQLDPVEGHWAQAKLAEKRKQFPAAEDHFRRAADLAPQQVGRLLDLAIFFTRQGRFQDADQSLARAEKLAPDSPKVIYAKAEVLLKSGRRRDAAKQLLERYLSSSLTPDDPPRSEARKLLRQAQGG